MDHKIFKSKISEYIDKKLSAGELAEFDRHAKGCPDCLLELRMSVKAVAEMKRSKSAKEIDLPANFYAKLGQNLDKADAEKLRRKSFIYMPWFRAAALSFALILTVVMVRQITKSPEYIGNKGFDRKSAMTAEEAPAPAAEAAGLASVEKETMKSDKAVAYKSEAKKKAAQGSVMKAAKKPMALRAKAEGKIGFEGSNSAGAGVAESNYSTQVTLPPASAPAMESLSLAKTEAPSRSMAAMDAAKDEEQAMPAEEMKEAPRTAVIKDKKTWASYAADKTAEPDFSRQMAIFVSLGERPTAGYGVEFVDIKYTPNKIVVYIKEITPKPGVLTAQVITHPAGMKVISRSELPVEFVFVK